MSKLNFNKCAEVRKEKEYKTSPRFSINYATPRQIYLMLELNIDFARLISRQDAAKLIAKELDKKQKFC